MRPALPSLPGGPRLGWLGTIGYRWTPQEKQADVEGQALPRLERVVNPKRCFVIILSLGHAAFAQAQPVPQAPAGNAVPVTADNFNRAETDMYFGKRVKKGGRRLSALRARSMSCAA